MILCHCFTCKGKDLGETKNSIVSSDLVPWSPNIFLTFKYLATATHVRGLMLTRVIHASIHVASCLGCQAVRETLDQFRTRLMAIISRYLFVRSPWLCCPLASASVYIS